MSFLNTRERDPSICLFETYGSLTDDIPRLPNDILENMHVTRPPNEPTYTSKKGAHRLHQLGNKPLSKIHSEESIMRFEIQCVSDHH